jgi:dihydrofolate synthase / folylpolyglutamate synthase
MSLSYGQALAYIHSFDDPYLAAIRDHGQQTWGLDRIRARLAELGKPHLAYPTIHVAGTKGKGSTAAFIAQGSIGSGLKTGLYVSPHLEDWRERIQINRELISEAALAQLVEDYQRVSTTVEGLSAFEVTTALAFWHFAREKCNVAVVEVGLGGRLDATTVVEPVVSVITNISLDHTQLLGETLAEIAGEKAAIIKPATPVISAPQMAAASDVIAQRALAMDSPLIRIGREWEAQLLSQTWDGSEAEIGPVGQPTTVHVALPGAFQVENAAVAAAALKTAQERGLPIKSEAIWRAMSETTWPGRLEIVARDPLIVVDSAHNPYSIERLVDAIRNLGQYDRLSCVFGCMADKDIEAMLTALLPACHVIVFTQSDNPRAAPAQALHDRAAAIVAEGRGRGKAWARRLHLAVVPRLDDAIDHALVQITDSDALCVTGSMALAGEARTLLRSRSSTRQSMLAQDARLDDNPA